MLTTAVINWARTSVKELDLARRLVHHAVERKVLPKYLEPGLVMLRDVKVPEYGEESLQGDSAADQGPELAAVRGGRGTVCAQWGAVPE